MHKQFQTEDLQLYRDYIKGEARKACLTLSGLAASLFPALVFLDYLSYPEQFHALSIIRFCTSLLFIVVFILFKKGYCLSRPILAGGICVLLATTSLTLMCMALEGSASPYYAGVFLVALGCIVIMPCRALEMATIMGLVLLIYVFGILYVENFTIKSFSNFVLYVHVLLCTGVIGVTAAYFSDRMRRESFFRYLEISRSAELLRNELQGKRGSIEELALSIVARKGEVQDALDLRNNFISIASHELKTPLTSLVLQMDLGRVKLKNGTLDLPYCEKIMNTFDVQLNRIVRIVDEMLDVSRIESNRFELLKTETDLSELVQNVLALHFSHVASLEYKKIANIRGLWDPYRIEQVVINLISNAIRYGEGKPIEIEVRQSEEEAHLSVKDYGKGIATTDHHKIFDKFERGNASKNYGGLGLGLYISKQIIDAHGGRIVVESELGKGSQFNVYLR